MPFASISPANVTPVLLHVHGFWDPFSAASHLLGAGAFLFLGVRLVCRGAPDRGRQALLGIYAFACVLLLGLSGAYHATTDGGAANDLLVRLDHGAIFLLIAGTFTPIHGLLFKGPMRWAPLAFIWSAALAGAVLKIAYFHAVPEWVGLMLFLVLGWLGFVGGTALWRREGFAFVRPLVLGGAAFTVGGLMDFFRWPMLLPGVVHAHDVFHVMALIGFAYHFRFIWQFAEPQWMGAATPADASAGTHAVATRHAPRHESDDRRFGSVASLLPAAP